jgi:hypothetical protein
MFFTPVVSAKIRTILTTGNERLMAEEVQELLEGGGVGQWRDRWGQGLLRVGRLNRRRMLGSENLADRYNGQNPDRQSSKHEDENDTCIASIHDDRASPQATI